MLVGRDSERALLGDLLEDAARGRSRVRLLVGDPGAGKTALLDDLAATAADRGMRVGAVKAVETERAIPGAALSLLVASLVDVVADLPTTAADRLSRTARGIVAEELPGDVLDLLTRAAEARPLLLTADDVQWWDPESLQAFVFAARRLAADDVAVVLAGRTEALDLPGLGALDRLVVPPLDLGAATELLRSVAPDLVPEVAATLAESLGGNPMALVETPALLEPRVRTGAAPMPVPVPVGSSVATRWAEATARLPASSRLALAILATDDTGSPECLEEAWAAAGCTTDDLVAAEAVHLVSFTSRGWQFPHPLVRSAAFAAMAPPERRHAHQALAAALDGTGRDAHFARHLAAGAVGPDATAAGRLVDVANALAAAGAVVPAAAAATDAVRLTPPGPLRVPRLLSAASLCLDALDEGAAAELAEEGLASDPDPLSEARLHRILGVAIGSARDSRRGVTLLRTAAAQLDDGERMSALVDALSFAKMWNDPAATIDLVEEMGDLSRLDPWMCLDVGVALAEIGRWPQSVPLLDRGLDEVDPAGPGVRETVCDAWDDAAAVRGLDSDVERYRDAARRLRDSGSAVRSESGLTMAVGLAYGEGHWALADELNEECRAFSVALGRFPFFSYGTDLRISARRGDRARFESAEQALRTAAHRSGLDLLVANADGLSALLSLSLGDLETAEPLLWTALEAAPTGMLVTTVFPPTAAALVELLAQSDRMADARQVADRVVRLLEPQPSHLALGYAERLLGLTRSGAEAERHLRAAVEHTDRGVHAYEAARARLVLGQWLRRRRRRSDAIEVLRPALAMFQDMGCDPWAERCRAELHAAGVDVRRQDPRDVSLTLTAQERRVAEAAADGLTNAAIARRLYLSAKTVELHLTHVYRKLGIAGRADLAGALQPADDPRRDGPADASRHVGGPVPAPIEEPFRTA